MSQQPATLDQQEIDAVLSPLREEINALDKQIIELLAKRRSVCMAVADVKKPLGISVMQPDRIDVVLEKSAAYGATLNLRPDFLRTLYRIIIKENCDIEFELMEQDS